MAMPFFGDTIRSWHAFNWFGAHADCVALAITVCARPFRIDVEM